MNRVLRPGFFYFDLGNVLLHFDHRLAARQMAGVAGLTPQRVWEVVFESGLERRYEAGELTSREFYSEFCSRTGRWPDYQALAEAGGAIFRPNEPVLALVARLRAAGHRLGLLSNTCQIHWDYFGCGRYCPIPEAFEVVALSFRLKALKPDPRIYQAATELAGVSPADIFFVDDVAGHVSAARAAGWDAVEYTTPAALVEDLSRRGIRGRG